MDYCGEMLPGGLTNMGVLALIKNYILEVKDYILTHKHAFLISLGVSTVVTLASNVLVYHLGYWLHFFHVPAFIIHWLGYK